MHPWGFEPTEAHLCRGGVSLETQRSLDADLTQGDACCLVQQCRNVWELSEPAGNCTLAALKHRGDKAFFGVMSCFVTQLTHTALCSLSLHLTGTRANSLLAYVPGVLGPSSAVCLPAHPYPREQARQHQARQHKLDHLECKRSGGWQAQLESSWKALLETSIECCSQPYALASRCTSR